MEQPMKPPRCERKGTLPHPATNALTWELQSGRLTKFFCDDHALDAQRRPYRLAKLIEYHEQVKSTKEEEESPCAQ